MNATLSRASRLLCATTLALVLLAAPAYAADTPFTPRFAQTVRGDIAAVGQHADDLPDRDRRLHRTRRAVGGTLNNNNYNMGYVDVDADATTFDSSSATRHAPGRLDRAVGRPLLGRRHDAGTSGAAAPTPRAAARSRSEGPGAAPTRPSTAARRRRPHLDLAGQPLPRLPRRDRARGRRRQRHLHGGERPGGHRQGPLRRLGAVRRLPRQRAAVRAPARLRRAGHGRRDAHLPDHGRAVPHAGHRRR